MRFNRTVVRYSMKALSVILFFSLAGVWGCTLMSPSSSNVQYGEDLSRHRPPVEADTAEVQSNDPKDPVDVTPSYDDTAQINQKLGAINRENKSDGLAEGYTIQVYSGTSRELATKAKAKVYGILPDARPETKYEQPVYKVRVGEFGDRLEAQLIFAELMEEFPEAIVIPHRIKL